MQIASIGLVLYKEKYFLLVATHEGMKNYYVQISKRTADIIKVDEKVSIKPTPVRPFPVININTAE